MTRQREYVVDVDTEPGTIVVIDHDVRAEDFRERDVLLGYRFIGEGTHSKYWRVRRVIPRMVGYWEIELPGEGQKRTVWWDGDQWLLYRLGPSFAAVEHAHELRAARWIGA